MRFQLNTSLAFIKSSFSPCVPPFLYHTPDRNRIQSFFSCRHTQSGAGARPPEECASVYIDACKRQMVDRVWVFLQKNSGYRLNSANAPLGRFLPTTRERHHKGTVPAPVSGTGGRPPLRVFGSEAPVLFGDLLQAEGLKVVRRHGPQVLALPGADGDRAVLHIPVADDQHIGDLLHLGLADLVA